MQLATGGTTPQWNVLKRKTGNFIEECGFWKSKSNPQMRSSTINCGPGKRWVGGRGEGELQTSTYLTLSIQMFKNRHSLAPGINSQPGCTQVCGSKSISNCVWEVCAFWRELKWWTQSFKSKHVLVNWTSVTWFGGNCQWRGPSLGALVYEALARCNQRLRPVMCVFTLASGLKRSAWSGRPVAA